MWGPDDVLGCLNLATTPDRVLAGARCVRKGSVFALGLDMGLPDPALFGRSGPSRRIVKRTTFTTDECLDEWNTQAGSQWDGFGHVAHPERGLYNGLPDEAHGVGHWAARGIVGRGVLADVARWREAQGRPLQPNEADPIEPDDIPATLDAQGVAVEPGDVLCIRTGWLSWYRGLDTSARSAVPEDFKACGLRPGEATARMLWDLHPAAVGADNPALEAWPPYERSVEAFLHFRLLPLLGLPIGELWDLDALADDCRADGVYEFFFTSAPLPLAGGIASPPNALAVK